MDCTQIKEFINKEIGFDISRNSGEYGTRANGKAFLRWAYFYLCVKYSTNYISHEIISKEVKMKRLSVKHGLESFEHLMKYDKLENQNFTILESKFIKTFKPLERKGEIEFDYEESRLKQKIHNYKFTAKRRRVKIASLKERVRQLNKSNKKYRELLRNEKTH